METIQFNNTTIRKWEVGASTFLAWPECGARLMNWHISMADSSVRDIIYWPEDADFSRPAKIRGGNPILFPFAARTYDQGELGYWRTADGQRRPMPMHGFCREGDFKLTTHNDKGFIATFQPSDFSHQAYPYEYTFTVQYRFEELALHVDFQLDNHGNDPIPWSPGHHFYFALPWHPDTARKDYRIAIPAKKAFYHLDDGSLDPLKDFPAETPFADPALNDRIHCKLKENAVRFGPKSGEEDITIRIGQAGKPGPWATFVTWTESDDSPFYCVEPWMAPPNAPEHKNGLRLVEPGKRDAFSVSISLIG